VLKVGVEYVKWFCIRGNYDLDELTLIGRKKRSYHYAGGDASLLLLWRVYSIL
jgi:hypothetical protein